MLALSQDIGTQSPDTAFKNSLDIARSHRLATTNVGKLVTIFTAFGYRSLFRRSPDNDLQAETVYASWDVGVTRTAERIETVILDDSLKVRIIEDVQKYLNVDTQAEYAALGVPWRRGLLFYGPPGTGKTSLVAAIASNFKLPIYVLGLATPGLNDSVLDQLFEQLPPHCIALIEDVDSAGIRREHMDGTRYRKNGMADGSERKGVTLSGLLNVLDGVYAAEGRITIMTTNHIDRLDEALIRDGRIDQKFKLTYASPEVAAKFFKRIFGMVPKDAEAAGTGLTARSIPNGIFWSLVRTFNLSRTKSEDTAEPDGDDSDEASGKRLLTETELEEFAQTFAAHIPPDELTPAELQSYLLQHRADTSAAVENAAAWVRGLRESKEPRKATSATSDGGSSGGGDSVPGSSGRSSGQPVEEQFVLTQDTALESRDAEQAWFRGSEGMDLKPVHDSLSADGHQCFSRWPYGTS
ncbi:hypothetical protein LTR65_008061 [Meristemomyces frigidus]